MSVDGCVDALPFEWVSVRVILADEKAKQMPLKVVNVLHSEIFVKITCLRHYHGLLYIHLTKNRLLIGRVVNSLALLGAVK